MKLQVADCDVTAAEGEAREDSWLTIALLRAAQSGEESLDAQVACFNSAL